MEEEKTLKLFDPASLRDAFQEIKENAKEQALIQLDQELSKIYEAVRDTTLQLIDEKVEEATRAVTNHLHDLEGMDEDVAGKLYQKAEQFAQNSEQKEKCMIKLRLSRERITDILRSRAIQYNRSQVSLKMRMNLKKAVDHIVTQMGLELQLDDEWVIRKQMGTTLKEYGSSEPVEHLSSFLGKEKSRVMRIMEGVTLGSKVELRVDKKLAKLIEKERKKMEKEEEKKVSWWWWSLRREKRDQKY